MAIQPNNSLTQASQSKVIDPSGMKPTAFFTSAAVRSLLVNTFGGNQQKAAVVTATLLSILGSSPDFQSCNPMELFANVLRYEVGMGLSYAYGDYAVINYGGKPQFQMQYQGVTRMAFAAGAYVDGDVFDVREGEYKGLDRRTRQPIIEWIEDDEIRLEKKIVGYYAWCQLVDKPPYYGRFKSKYMSHEEILRHADRYSKPFQKYGGIKAYKAAMEGKREWIKGNTPWFAPPDDTGHVKMCKKTVLLQLFKDPMLPKSNGIFDQAIEADEMEERTGEAVRFGDEYDRMAKEAALAAQRETPAIEQAQNNTEPTPEPAPVRKASRKRETATAKGTDSSASLRMTGGTDSSAARADVGIGPYDAQNDGAKERIAAATAEPQNDGDVFADYPDISGDPFGDEENPFQMDDPFK